MALVQERNRLFAYPLELLASGIAMAGFECTGCGMCCTRGRDHPVFMLDKDVVTIRSIDPEGIIPDPKPDFCDQNGVLYVSGYAIRTKNDGTGSCWFRHDGRCRIYDMRATACRMYPYKLRREPEPGGSVDWQMIAHYGSHGRYHQKIPSTMCEHIAREVKEYENALLTRELAYLRFLQEYFAREGLWHSDTRCREQVRSLERMEPVRVMVYFEGDLVAYSPEPDRQEF